MTATSRVLTLERALQILEYIVEHKKVSVTGVAKSFGIQRSASYRFLNTFKYMGYLEQTPFSDYTLTNRLQQLGRGIVPRIEMRNYAWPYLEELVKKAHQPSNLGFWDGQNIVYIAQKTFNGIMEGYATGNTIPAYCSAMGKAVLAFLSDDELDAYLKKTPLVAYTAKTVTSAEALRKQLEEVRQQGYAVMNREMADYLLGVAAPVFNRQGLPRYAISVAGTWFGDENAFVELSREKLIETARELSEFLRHATTMEDK